MAKLTTIFSRGLAAARPAATAVPVASHYYSTDTKVYERNNGSSWDTVSALPVGEHAIVFHSATQAINDATWTELAFDSEDADSDGFHSNVSNNARLTIPSGKGGLYLVTLHASFAANTTGDRHGQITVNGNTPGGANKSLYMAQRATTAFETRFSLSGLIRLSAGDYISGWVFQNSGGSLNVGNAATRDLQCQFECVRLAA